MESSQSNLNPITDEELKRYAGLVSDELNSLKVPPVFAPPLDLEDGMTLTEPTLEAVRIFMANTEARASTKPGLYIFGGPGAGKTRLAHIIRYRLLYDRHERMKQGHRLHPRKAALFFSVNNILRREKQDFDLSPEYKVGLVNEILGDRRLLFLDDLGAEKATDWALETLFTIINDRYERMLPTVYTSNLSLQQLSETLGDRIASRIAGSCIVINLGNVDRRIELMNK